MALFVLAAVPAIRAVVPADGWPLANARIELARAAVTLAAPVIAGVLAQRASPGGAPAAAPLRCGASREWRSVLTDAVDAVIIGL